jgi:SAM-dependent methyltransferase
MEKNFYAEYFEIEEKHWWFIGRQKIVLRLLEKHLPASDRSMLQIVDVGCGTGTMLQHLMRFGHVQGLETDSEAIQFCRMRGLENVQPLNGTHLPFEDESLDLVTMFDVLEHIADEKGAVSEAHRVLKSAGTFMATVPAYQFLWGPQDVISHHKRRYVARTLRSVLENSGFRLTKLSYFNSTLFLPIAAIRVGRRLLGLDENAHLKSDFTLTNPGLINSALAKLFALEASIIEKFSIPFGVSIVCMARKREG